VICRSHISLTERYRQAKRAEALYARRLELADSECVRDVGGVLERAAARRGEPPQAAS